MTYLCLLELFRLFFEQKTPVWQSASKVTEASAIGSTKCGAVRGSKKGLHERFFERAFTGVPDDRRFPSRQDFSCAVLRGSKNRGKYGRTPLVAQMLPWRLGRRLPLSCRCVSRPPTP